MLTLGKIDHIHVRVADLKVALDWYERVLGMNIDTRYRHMQEGHGITMLSNPSASVRLALSEEAGEGGALPGTVAFSVGGQEFLAWIDALAGQRVRDKDGETIARDSVRDHAFFLSINFVDPFGNPFEIVSYDHTWLAAKLKLNGRGAH
ncbi:catechol 2,3-dioxygenase-like lactoylglutathione lyase family enzyme [Crenobacter luteus]|uniref:Glyoxalase n=1 Tax=Crenobacter luteus TaxID=1452487 RepID=A0A161R8X1_9NEIS|nr:VOC family protein [Crenobacter luteus]KZE33208.1 glyoxalase [Crenobacter luteus]TCP08495.1 catechol 2,3-dioxygenase-like lactoylglutathione lyase family enzyme [Crenobacter luteus]